MSAYERLLLPENLYYAWQKAKRLYRISDGYIDRGELADFELDLERQLRRIQQQFEKGTYRLKSVRALPRPKKIVDGKSVNRQYYHVAVKDQVAWIAIANAIGPELDQKMPAWSYGNRLYRPAWYEDREKPQSKLEIGPYRHASGNLYRKFQHSWPLFRRHVALTARIMVRLYKQEDLDTADRLAVASAKAEKLPYLDTRFWQRGVGQKKQGKDLYFASIDLKNFYPTIRSDAVLKGLAAAASKSSQQTRFCTLLETMHNFQLDKTEVPETAMGEVEPKFGGRHVKGLPTGLFVAGFLANVAMLTIDEEVNRRILKDRGIAHFRFVDDHTILAYDFDELCEWIDWYKNLLAEHGIGPTINEKKCDPESLIDWMSVRVKTKQIRGPVQRQRDETKRLIALADTKIDGANPTKLLTKTLGQISLIATTSTDTLDDKDLEEQLNLLEWLLLADIPERELRPDTRAAFAAGRIAVLAPILTLDTGSLVDDCRAVARLNSQISESKAANQKEMDVYKEQLSEKARAVAALQIEFDEINKRRLRHYYGLLLQAFTEFPSKPRLFYRLLQYCRLTGHDGLTDIAKWIKRTRNKGHLSWADYYCGLTQQILADSILRAVRTALSTEGLHSFRVAALRHLRDIAGLDASVISVPQKREAWFHAVGRRELAVSAMSASEVLGKHTEHEDVAQRLRLLSTRYAEITFSRPSADWLAQTGYRPGTWSHHVESALAGDAKPSVVWECFESCFDYNKISDHRAARLYPEILSDTGWSHFLQSKQVVKEDDSGWVSEALAGNAQRISESRSSTKKAYRRALNTIEPPSKEWILATEWTHFVKIECSAFDPRRSEWTALEIIRQVVASALELGSQERLNRIHPSNVLIPAGWKTRFPADFERARVSWENWRAFVSSTKKIKLMSSGKSILDYRYLNYAQNAPNLDFWERRLISIGRLLLGLLRFNHDSPRIWNIRGNERVTPLPLALILESLAVSSPTLLLLEGCLSGRVAETRTIARQPGLFGWRDGEATNDARFDPPSLETPNELYNAIENAQSVLAENQLAVSLNQPRQLIPVQLSELAIGPNGEGEDGVHGE